MHSPILFVLLFAIPPILAYRLARRWGRSGFKWAIICFCTHYFGLLLLILLPSQATPTLQRYRLENPQCATKHGMCCNSCGSRSIRIWRKQWMFSVKQYHVCNHCGESLYTT